MPGKDELRAMLLATLQAPLQQFVALLQAPAQNFVYLLAAKEKKALGPTTALRPPHQTPMTQVSLALPSVRVQELRRISHG